MAAQPVRVTAKTKPARVTRPLVVEVAMRVPPLGRAGVVAALKLPQGRLRRTVGEWAFREIVVGSANRRDYEALKKFSAPDLEVRPAAELLAVLPGHGPVVRGGEAFQRFVEDWMEVWGAFTFVPKEGVDLGDGRVLVLNHLQGHGASSGVEIRDQKEAELWEARNGLAFRMQQWWSWREALDAVGLRPPEVRSQ